jgi:hypothetical protein
MTAKKRNGYHQPGSLPVYIGRNGTESFQVQAVVFIRKNQVKQKEKGK